MSAALHLTALIVSCICLMFTIRDVRAGHWHQAVIDTLMIVAMVATVFAPRGSTSLLAGAALIALAVFEAATIRIRSRSAGLHFHRPLCFLVMGSTTIVMAGHEALSSTVHSHGLPIQFFGLLGIAIVGVIALGMRKRFTFSAGGMLVATGLMSVATVAA